MKYFAACVDDTGIKAASAIPPKRVLLSYHYYSKKGELIKGLLKDGFEVFLDSGAFSAMNSGKTIDIDAYCKFILDTGVIYYASLDVIGNAQETMKNYEYMKKEYGLKPIPTFHMGSKIEDLYPLLTENYIALGGLVFSSGIQNHCDLVWETILKEMPDLKVHGFGLTNINLMSRYPWHSVDSSSFQGCRRFGRQSILWDGFNFKTFQEEEFLNYLEEYYGYDIAHLKDHNKERIYLYDLYAVNSIKLYAQHLGEINKIKKFNYLTNQIKLF